MAYDGETIQAARLKLGMTIQELGVATGAGTRTATRWQRDGIKDNSRFLAIVERVLGLEAHTEARVDDRKLSDLTHGELWSLHSNVASEIQTRFWKRTRTGADPWPGGFVSPPEPDEQATPHSRADLAD